MEIHSFFLILALVLITARLFSELFAFLNIPPVMGELFAGILLGSSILGIVEPTQVLRLLAEIGIILLLFEVGLETDLKRLAGAGTNSTIVAFTGAIFPFLIGFFTAWQGFGLEVLPSLFIGGTLTATSIGITLRVLKDIHQEQSNIAQVVIGAAVIDDILGVILLVFIYDFAVTGEMSFMNTAKVGAMVILFVVLAPSLAYLFSRFIRHYDFRHKVPGFIPAMIISLILLFAWFSHVFGAPEILGSFAAGLALSRRFFLPFGAAFRTDPDFERKIEENMKPIIQLFTPVFFVMVGLSIDLRVIDFTSWNFWVMSLVFLAVASLGKYAGAFLTQQACNMNKTLIGISMIPRGEVGLIFAELGRNTGILTPELYAILIFVIIVTTVVPPFLLKWLFKYECA